MAEQLRSVFAMDACIFRLWKGDDLVLLACAGLPEEVCPERVPVKCGIASEVLKRQSPLFIPDVMQVEAIASEMSRPPSPRAFTSYAGAPMLAGNRVIGIIGLYSRTRRDDLDQEDLDCIQMMANCMSLAIANDELYAEVLANHARLKQEMRARRETERESRELREELTRMSRVTAMGELTATIAHEVNQPLGAVMANAQACQRFLDDPAPDYDEVRRALADIVKDASRATQVVAQVRKSLSRAAPRYHPVDLNQVVRDVVRMLDDRIQADRISLQLRLGRNLPPVSGAETQLQQVILNLLTNAIEAARETTVPPPRVVISTRRSDGRVVEVAVRDNGPGVPNGDTEAIFAPFFTTKPGGIGMGLAICRSITEAHQGQLRAERARGGGSVFRLTVPIKEARDS